MDEIYYRGKQKTDGENQELIVLQILLAVPQNNKHTASDDDRKEFRN